MPATPFADRRRNDTLATTALPPAALIFVDCKSRSSQQPPVDAIESRFARVPVPEDHLVEDEITGTVVDVIDLDPIDALRDDGLVRQHSKSGDSNRGPHDAPHRLSRKEGSCASRGSP